MKKSKSKKEKTAMEKKVKDSEMKMNRVVVADGEVTGHHHVVEGLGVCLEGDTLSVPAGGNITHEEHKAFELPAGVYDRRIVTEYDPFLEESRKVRD